jgi:hypothetical protein
MLGIEKIVFKPRCRNPTAIENIAFDCLRNRFLDPFSRLATVIDASYSLAAGKRARQMRFLNTPPGASEMSAMSNCVVRAGLEPLWSQAEMA